MTKNQMFLSLPNQGGSWFDEREVTQRKKNRSQMAKAHIPKHVFSSPGCDGLTTFRTHVVLFYAFVALLHVHSLAKELTVGPFSAEGTILTEVFLQEGRLVPDISTSVKFIFNYSNGWWQIQNHYVNGTMMGVADTKLPGTLMNCRRIPDGIRYYSTKEIRDVDPRALLGDVTNQKPLTAASVESFLYPPPEMPELFVCWLSLCPIPELPVIDSRWIRRLTSRQFMGHPKNIGEYSIRYIRPDSFVSELYITNNGVLFMADNAALQLDPPLGNGYLEFSYRVLETTNVEGIIFPLSVSLTKYVPNDNAKTSFDTRPNVIARLRIDRIQLGWHSESSNSTPVLMAFDNRFSKSVSGVGLEVNYVVTNDHWHSATNANLVELAKFSNQIASERGEMRRSHVRTTVFVCLALLATIPICLVFLRNNKNKQLNDKI